MREVPPVRIGVDIGGTFTDLQIFDARSGAIFGFKTPTTPEDPSIGLMTGIKQAADRYGFTLADVGFLLHGTTIATNAILERKLPKAVLVTTAGFEDVLEIGRHVRREVYALNPPQPPTLIARDRRIGIAERVRADGSVEMALTPAGLETLGERIEKIDPACVAVCLMNSYLNPEHEQRIADYLAKVRPALKVSCSSALSAEIREYERTSTTVLNALLIPVIAGYLDKLSRRMEAEGFAPRLLLVQSNGGVCSARTAALEPVRLLLSGPSGGSAACALLSAVLGEDNLIGVDMGGTSFDVSVVRNGRVNVVMQGEVDRMPVRIPMVEIRAIGAGGGSLAKVANDKRLTVGPESAGSRPGPACYGRGGTGPTVTDANVTLGRLDGEKFLGGGMRLDLEAARTVVDTEVAKPLGLSVEAAAEGLLAVTNANMGAAIRLSLFEKGVDPREFTMIAFGGAAGLHAVAVADETGIRRVVFPQNASTLSAYGILHSDLIHDLVRSRVLDAKPEHLGIIEPLLENLLADARARLEADAIPENERHIELAADMHYKGQAFELTVPFRSLRLDEPALSTLIADFHDLHCQRFSYSNPGSAVEIVSLRASAIGRLAKPAAKPPPVPDGGRPAGARKVWLGGRWRDIAVWNRDDLAVGTSVRGPAVIEEAYTSVLLAEGWTCRRETSGHLVAGRQE
ncbi:MAG TPA: hydantoinase/oxoprolinase family protein [Bradyrhizobium sp.]|uniref:hydantoinase/oxoprolinase family protein n=1 Tax=Bradyrhizobium sp. TaxID=376 RepID=UPI002D7E7D79|nr:hydantoinase/oxoprolinase family protein [Bradyrhizobium sp.]HET7889417.1 hydantoinase/oxoprolinase family protein [Bradyrhizobium sp.]